MRDRASAGSVVVAHARPRVGWLDAEPLQHGHCMGGHLQGWCRCRHGAPPPRRAPPARAVRRARLVPDLIPGMGGVSALSVACTSNRDLRLKDATGSRYRSNQAALDLCRQERHVPAPRVAWAAGDVQKAGTSAGHGRSPDQVRGQAWPCARNTRWKLDSLAMSAFQQQQLCYRAVLTMLSVSGHFRLPAPPEFVVPTRAANFSDGGAGGPHLVTRGSGRFRSLGLDVPDFKTPSRSFETAS